jgi:hypothetical protein
MLLNLIFGMAAIVDFALFVVDLFGYVLVVALWLLPALVFVNVKEFIQKGIGPHPC